MRSLPRALPRRSDTSSPRHFVSSCLRIAMSLWMNRLVILCTALLVLCAMRCTAQAPESVPMKVLNLAGEPIELFWIDEDHQEFVSQLQRPLRNGSETSINSFEGHRFAVRFLHDRAGIEAEIVKSAQEETVLVTFDEDAQELRVQQRSPHHEEEEKASLAVDRCAHLLLDTTSDSDVYAKCVADHLYEEVKRLQSEKLSAKKYRDAISLSLRNYTCADPTMPTSEPIREYPFTHAGKDYNVRVMLDLSHAKIWAVDDFLTEEECDILVEHGRPKLHRATVAAEDGTSVVSENRKAQQASYNLHKENDKDPLWPLQQRILTLTNQHAGYNLTSEGQEGFTIIQYNPDDQYTPHCDGSCDSSMHVPTGRIATAVLYCKVPEIGGATTFTKADIFVKPKAGAATFFAYKGPDGRMDDGFTEHSGCPVVQGEKWITTFWMRDGVTAESPHSLFDPSGLRILTDTD